MEYDAEKLAAQLLDTIHALHPGGYLYSDVMSLLMTRWPQLKNEPQVPLICVNIYTQMLVVDGMEELSAMQLALQQRRDYDQDQQ